MSKKLLIVYHSYSGATAQLAAAARGGAQQEAELTVQCLRAWDAGAQHLLECDGFLLGFAENSGAVAGAMKDFLDRVFYPLQSCEMIKPCGLFVSAGNDGRGAVAQVQRVLRGMPGKEVAAPVICRGEPTGEALAQCNELGHTLAAGVNLGIY
jgi:multimeric flavodoxin WrbA